jgi:hypothetical protein
MLCLYCWRNQDLLDGYDPYPEAQKKILKLCYTVPPHTSSVNVVWRQGEAGLRIYADAPHTDGPKHCGQCGRTGHTRMFPPQQLLLLLLLWFVACRLLLFVVDHDIAIQHVLSVLLCF